MTLNKLGKSGLDRNRGWSNKGMLILMAVCLLLQMLLYNYLEFLNLGPYSVHYWRQADCFSFALSFYEGIATFWEPAVNNLGSSGTGQAASDFPLIQYVVALIWKVTGVKPIVFRLITAVLFFTGLIFLYKLFDLFLEDNKIMAVILTGLVFTSTTLAFYGVSVISDIHAMSFAFIGLYYFFLADKTLLRRHLIYSVLAFSLAGLLKMSSSFSYGVCLVYAFSKHFHHSGESFLQRIKNTQKINILIFLMPFLTWFFWYSHVDTYNKEHPSGFFLIGVKPFWEMPDGENRLLVFRRIIYEMLMQSFPVYLYLFVALFALGLLFSRPGKYRLELVVIFTCIVLFVSFIALFFQVLGVHDYYYINPSILLIIAGLFILRVIKTSSFASILNARTTIALLVIVWVFYVWRTSGYVWGRYRLDNTTTNTNALFFTSTEAWNVAYSSEQEKKRFQVMERKRFDAEKIGIKKEDVVYCMGDLSINRSLFLLKRRGYTNYNIPPEMAPSLLKSEPFNNIDYLIVMDDMYLKDDSLQPFLTNKTYDMDGLQVYKLK